MKKFLLLLLILAAFFYSNCQESGSIKRPSQFSMNQIIHNIPGNKKEQQDLINHYIESGYGGLTVNVSFNNYLTEKGMVDLRSFCSIAKKKGLELWFYDELGYPSGNAGGRVILQNEKWEALGIFKKDTVAKSGEIKYSMPPGYPIKVVACNQNDTINLLSKVQNGILRWNAPKGEWKIVAFSKHTLYHHFQASRNPNNPKEKISSHYPSLMIPEVTQAFIQTTHEKYVEYLGTDLGRYFISTFTDEPSLMAVSFFEEDWSVIPWSSILSDTIKQRYGYWPEDKLLELFEDKGPNGKKLRFQYFHTVGELISVNYFKQLKEWGAQHNIKSGGHLLLEETMMAHVPLYGDIFACYRQMDVPGIDALSCFPKNTPVHAPKLASSAAEITGASHIMCEPCPVIDRRNLEGKEPETEIVRGFFNIQMAGGITDFNNYLRLSNATKDEKIKFNQYVSRIAMHLNGGHSVADIAVHYPIESLWVDYIPEPISVAGWDSVRGGYEQAVNIEQSFRNTTRLLYKDRWEYNIIDTKAIEDSRVENGYLIHGNLKWKLIILPNVSTLSIHAMEKLHRFVKSGGFLIAVGQTPVNSTIKFPDKRIISISDKILKTANAKVINTVSEISINNLLSQWLRKDIIVSNSQSPIRFAHRFIDSEHVYFVFNDSDQNTESDLFLRDLQKACIYEPESGRISKKESNRVLLHFEPYQGVIIKNACND